MAVLPASAVCGRIFSVVRGHHHRGELDFRCPRALPVVPEMACAHEPRNQLAARGVGTGSAPRPPCVGAGFETADHVLYVPHLHVVWHGNQHGNVADTHSGVHPRLPLHVDRRHMVLLDAPRPTPSLVLLSNPQTAPPVPLHSRVGE